jgi:hypothetical protein
MKHYARWLFGIAAALNLLVAVGLLFLRPWLAPVLGLNPITGTNLVLVNFAGAMIGLFGYGYLRIAGDPVKFRPLIHYSAAGKLLAVAGAAWPWLSGEIPSTIPLVLSADVFFAALFVDYLRRTTAPQWIKSDTSRP